MVVVVAAKVVYDSCPDQRGGQLPRNQNVESPKRRPEQSTTNLVV